MSLLVLLAGCIRTQDTAAGSAGNDPSVASTGTVLSAGTPAGPTTSTSSPATGAPSGTTAIAGPACYVTHRLLSGEIELATIPTVNGVPIPLAGGPYLVPGGMGSTTGLQWFDGRWWLCTSGKLFALDPGTGFVADGGWCGLVAVIGGRLAVQPASGYDYWSYFVDRTQVLAGTPAEVVHHPWPTLMRATSDGTTLYGAWHTTDRVTAIDIATNAQTEIVLTGFYSYLTGFAFSDGLIRATDDGADPTANAMILYREFDLTGAEANRVEIGQQSNVNHVYSGMWCGTPTP